MRVAGPARRSRVPACSAPSRFGWRKAVMTSVLTSGRGGSTLPCMGAKTQLLQVRVTAAQKEALRRAARDAGLDVSSFVLARVLPVAKIRFRELVEALRRDQDRPFLLAELNDLLASLTATAFVDAVSDADLRAHGALTANYIAAMIEHTAARLQVDPPAWTRHVEVLELPYFASDLRSLRPWLLAASPVAFKRRNLFVDSTVGDRV